MNVMEEGGREVRGGKEDKIAQEGVVERRKIWEIRKWGKKH